MKKTKGLTIVLLYFVMLIFLISSGCSSSGGSDSDSQDSGRASGQWSYHSGTDLNAITIYWMSVDFPCNGPALGYETFRPVITATTMTWDDMAWTRESGTAGDPVGTWTATSNDGGTYELIIGDNGTISVSGTNISCTGNLNIVGTAIGTYAWNYATGDLTWNWDIVRNFNCNGPQLGTQSEQNVTVTHTTMTWGDMTWMRTDGETNDPAGIWTATDASGNSYTLVMTPTNATSGTGSVTSDNGGDCD